MSTSLTARYILQSSFEIGTSFSSIQRGNWSIPFAPGNTSYSNFLGDFGYFINEGD